MLAEPPSFAVSGELGFLDSPDRVQELDRLLNFPQQPHVHVKVGLSWPEVLLIIDGALQLTKFCIEKN